MKEMYVKNVTPELFQQPDLSDIIFKDDKGNIADGGQILVPRTGEYAFYQLYFESGVLTNFIDEQGHISPAVEGPGMLEYRTKGVLTSPDTTGKNPARICEGFNKREYWEHGKLVRVSEKSYDDKENAVWS